MSWFVISLVGSSLLLAIVSSDKSDIFVNAARESWISAEDFTILLEVSFNISKCCNLQISGHSAGTENLFNEFVKIYPYEYLVNNITYDCNGYFMISGSENDLVTDIEKAPTRISTTELLIILDGNAENSTRLFNASMYEYSNVNIAALDGLWTLSENFLKPRVFKKCSRYNEMVHKRGIVNLEGRELQSGAKYQPPLCYLKTAVNRTINGIKAEVFESKNQSELDGVELKLFMLIAERLNFTWTLRRPNCRDRYGAPNGTHWNGGLIGLLFHKEVDIVFGSVWLMESTYHYTNLTVPWSRIDLRFLVPRPKAYSSVWALTKPLSPEVWLAALAMLILQIAYVYTSSWISPRITNRFRSLTVTWMELIGRFLGTWAPKDMQGLKMQFQLWHFTAILLITAYSSSLAARLTNPDYDASVLHAGSKYRKGTDFFHVIVYHDRIDSPEDFIKANLTWGRSGPASDFRALLNKYDPRVKKFLSVYEQESSEDDRHERILKGNYAIIGRTIGTSFFPEELVRRDDLKHLRAMKQPIDKFYTAFAVQPWLLEPVDEVLSRLKEGGLVDYHMHDVLHRRTGSELREVLIEHDGRIKTPRVLKLTPLAAGFSMLIVGLIISSVVFCTELYTASRKKSICKVLVDIRRKREAWRVMKHKEKSGSTVMK